MITRLNLTKEQVWPVLVDHVHGGERPHGGVTAGVAHEDVPRVGGETPGGLQHKREDRGQRGQARPWL